MTSVGTPVAGNDAVAGSTSMQAAKDKFVVNVASNLLLIGMNAGVSILLAPYLIGRLGVAAYGMIALANSFPAYIRIASLAITNTVLRFISVSITDDRLEDANLYYNVAFKATTVLNLLLLVPVVLFSWNFSRWFNVPVGYERDTDLLIGAVLLSSMLMALASTIKVVYPLFHRFYLENLILGFCRISGVLLMLYCFWQFGARLVYVGYYQLAYAVLALIGLYFVQLKIQSSLRLRRGLFRLDALKELVGMGGWVLINDVAVLLYLTVGFVAVNQSLGAEATGRFGPVMLINSLLLSLAGSVSNVLVPVFYNLVGKSGDDDLSERVIQAVRIVGLMIGFPVVLLCAFARPIFFGWLGPEFADLWLLLWLVTISMWVGGICYLPVGHVFRGKNRVAVPAVVNLIGGILHIVTMVLLIEVFDLGLISFGISFAIFFGLRGVLVNGIYAAVLLKGTFWDFSKPIALLLPAAVCCSLIGLYAIDLSGGLDWIWLTIVCCLIVFAYGLYGLFVVLSSEDRKLLARLAIPSFRR